MIFISHRGNTVGKKIEVENSPSYIDLALSEGFDVEIDLWYLDNKTYLGHDNPQYHITIDWLIDRMEKLWIHCKNIECVNFLQLQKFKFNYFWHENDKITLTSKNYIWAYPGNQPIKNSISVLPELHDDNTSLCIGICSDVIEKYNKKI